MLWDLVQEHSEDIVEWIGGPDATWAQIMKGEAEIYCPLCAWRPNAPIGGGARPGAGAVWNTFWTRGCVLAAAINGSKRRVMGAARCPHTKTGITIRTGRTSRPMMPSSNEELEKV